MVRADWGGEEREAEGAAPSPALSPPARLARAEGWWGGGKRNPVRRPVCGARAAGAPVAKGHFDVAHLGRDAPELD